MPTGVANDNRASLWPTTIMARDKRPAVGLCSQRAASARVGVRHMSSSALRDPELKPADLGFTMPAEWAPHSGCWMGWPVRESIWQGFIEAARDDYARVA